MNSPSAPYFCSQCGTVLAVPGGRCPTCGAIQPEAGVASPEAPQGPQAIAPPRSGAPMQVRSVNPGRLSMGAPRSRAPESTKGGSDGRVRTLGIALATIFCVGAIGVVAWRIYPRSTAESSGTQGTESPQLARSGSPEAAISAGPQRFDPELALAKAQFRARAWDSDAVLVFVEASGLHDGQISPESGGLFRMVFGKPRGSKLGPGARLQDQFFEVRVDASGPLVVETKTPTPPSGSTTREAEWRGISAPECRIETAWRKMVASGSPSSADATIAYDFSEAHNRAVWRNVVLGDPKAQRVIDGRSCTVLTRQ